MITYMSDILCVTNRKLCREDLLKRVERVAACHPAGVILREKDMSSEEYRTLAEQVMEVCARYDVKCIIHSFADAAAELRAEAIHLPLHILRSMTEIQRAQFCTIGASCHSVEEALDAKALGCTYITAGHVFETDCKKGLPGRGLAFLQEVCASVDIPVYGIGGINPNNISQVRAAGASGVCLMSSLMMSEDVPKLMKSMEERR